MSYSCLRSLKDEAYHATCSHDCCGDQGCETRNRRWWGKATYDNGCKIIASENGIYTDADLEFLERVGLPKPTEMYSLNGVRVKDAVPLSVQVHPVAMAQGMVRPWVHYMLCVVVCSFLCGWIGA